jgi:hypothetical protein
MGHKIGTFNKEGNVNNLVWEGVLKVFIGALYLD